MDLRSGTPVWLLEPGAWRDWPDLEGPRDADVVVVGAGISGALAAVHLAEAGLDVLVLDRREAGRGSTLASTALLQYEIDASLVELGEKIGREPAARAYRRSAAAVERLGELVAVLGDDCGFAWRPSLYLGVTESDAALLDAEARARRACGIDVELLDARDLRAQFPFQRPAAIRSALAAEADPLRLTLSLLRRAEILGATIRTGPCAAVASLETGRTRPALTTAAGHVVRAGHAVFATGYESERYLAQPVGRLLSTYAMATEPEESLEAWEDRCLIWETARPYLYLRTTPSGRVIVGGEDERITDADARDARIGPKCADLVRRARAIWPSLRLAPECAWAGFFGETPDGLPVIGMPPSMPRSHFALGYGGNGITFSLIAAEIITAAITGCPDPDAALFSFGRSSLAG
jgi:glycine/D-amino acid oxidase-like deaminating enzyme